MPFEYGRRVRFQDADPAGIVFFANILTFCHEAYEELLRAEGSPLDVLLAEGTIGLPLRHADVDFLAPLRVGMAVRIAVTIGKLSERSFRADYALRDEAGRELARASTVHVAVDRKAMKAIALPAAIRAALERHAVSSPR